MKNIISNLDQRPLTIDHSQPSIINRPSSVVHRLWPIFFFFFIGLSSMVNGQSPQAIPYQAVARNSSGNLIANQNVSLRFSIHDLTATGSVVFAETQTATTNAYGLFSVQIGTGTTVVSFISLVDWSSGPKFMQTEIDVAGGVAYVDMGTNQMLSVPYALFSEKSGNGLPAASFGYTLYNGINGWTADNSLFNNGSSIGIGTVNPLGKVHIKTNSVRYSYGAVPTLTLEENENDYARLQFRNTTTTSTGDQSWLLEGYNDPTGADKDIFHLHHLATSIFQQAGGDYLTVLGNGKVGIGESNPARTLEVNAYMPGGAAEISIGNRDGFGKAQLSLVSDKGSVSEWRPGYIVSGDNGNFTGRMDFGNNGTGSGTNYNSVYAMSITNGKVGVGTVTPSSKLEVAGTTKTTNLQMTAGGASGAVLTSDAGGNASWNNPAGAAIGAILAYDGTGNVNWNNPVGFAAKISPAIIDIPSSALPITAVFDNELYDEGNAYNPATGIFTAPSAGMYHFDATVKWHTSFTTGVLYINLFVNGSAYVTTPEDFYSQNVIFTQRVSTDVLLNAGDLINIGVQHQSTFVQNIEGANLNSIFSGHKIR